MKREYDARLKTSKCVIKEGDLVLFKSNRNRTTMPEWDPEPFLVTNIKRSMISAKRGEQELARNSSFFKLYLSNSRVEETPEDAKEQEAVESEAEAEVGQARSRGSHGKRLDCGRARETWTWAAIKGGRTSYRG